MAVEPTIDVAGFRHLRTIFRHAFARRMHLIRIAHRLTDLAVVDAGEDDVHTHMCPNETCGKVWQHGSAVMILSGNSLELHDAAHHCPACGEPQFRREEEDWQ